MIYYSTTAVLVERFSADLENLKETDEQEGSNGPSERTQGGGAIWPSGGRGEGKKTEKPGKTGTSRIECWAWGKWRN